MSSPDLNDAVVSSPAARCSDGCDCIGVPDGDLHLVPSNGRDNDIVTCTKANVLRDTSCLSSRQFVQDLLSFVGRYAQRTIEISFVASIRRSDIPGIVLTRAAASLDCMLQVRHILREIFSELFGELAEPKFGSRRSKEVVHILHKAWIGEAIERDSDVYQFKGAWTKSARTCKKDCHPLPYLGSYSPSVQDQCRAMCDIYLICPEYMAQRMHDVHACADALDRTLDLGLRFQMIVRGTEVEAKDCAGRIPTMPDGEYRFVAMAASPLAWRIKHASGQNTMFQREEDNEEYTNRHYRSILAHNLHGGAGRRGKIPMLQ